MTYEDLKKELGEENVGVSSVGEVIGVSIVFVTMIMKICEILLNAFFHLF